jgi:hypothetical protein
VTGPAREGGRHAVIPPIVVVFCSPPIGSCQDIAGAAGRRTRSGSLTWSAQDRPTRAVCARRVTVGHVPRRRHTRWVEQGPIQSRSSPSAVEWGGPGLPTTARTRVTGGCWTTSSAAPVTTRRPARRRPDRCGASGPRAGGWSGRSARLAWPPRRRGGTQLPLAGGPLLVATNGQVSSGRRTVCGPLPCRTARGGGHPAHRCPGGGVRRPPHRAARTVRADEGRCTAWCAPDRGDRAPRTPGASGERAPRRRLTTERRRRRHPTTGRCLRCHALRRRLGPARVGPRPATAHVEASGSPRRVTTPRRAAQRNHDPGDPGSTR